MLNKKTTPSNYNNKSNKNNLNKFSKNIETLSPYSKSNKNYPNNNKTKNNKWSNNTLKNINNNYSLEITSIKSKSNNIKKSIFKGYNSLINKKYKLKIKYIHKYKKKMNHSKIYTEAK